MRNANEVVTVVQETTPLISTNNRDERQNCFQEYSDFIYSGGLGYLLTQGLDKLVHIDHSDMMGSTILYTMMPYFLGRFVDYGKDAIVNLEVDKNKFINILTRAAGSGVASGLGYLASQAGMFKNFSTYDTIALGAVGMIAGKCFETMAERSSLTRR